MNSVPRGTLVKNMKHGNNGEDGCGPAISPVTAKEPFSVKPENSKAPVRVDSGKLSGNSDKSTPAADEGWREKQYWQKRGG